MDSGKDRAVMSEMEATARVLIPSQRAHAVLALARRRRKRARGAIERAEKVTDPARREMMEIKQRIIRTDNQTTLTRGAIVNGKDKSNRASTATRAMGKGWTS